MRVKENFIASSPTHYSTHGSSKYGIVGGKRNKDRNFYFACMVFAIWSTKKLMISLTGCFCEFLRDLLLGSTHFPRKSSWEGPFQDSPSDPHLVYVIFAYISALPNCAIIAVPFFFSHHRFLQPTSPLDICWN